MASYLPAAVSEACHPHLLLQTSSTGILRLSASSMALQCTLWLLRGDAVIIFSQLTVTHEQKLTHTAVARSLCDS